MCQPYVWAQPRLADLIVTGVAGLPSSLPSATSGVGNRIQGGQSGVVDGAEHGVARRQQGILVHQEELAAVGTGPGVRHRHGAACIDDRLAQRGVGEPVLVGRVLVGESVAGPTVAAARRVTALQCREVSGGQPVALGAVEESPARPGKRSCPPCRALLPLARLRPMLPRSVTIPASTVAGSVGTMPGARRPGRFGSRLGGRRVLAVGAEVGRRRERGQLLFEPGEACNAPAGACPRRP